MQAISATAIAVDAFYASVKARAPVDRETEQAWSPIASAAIAPRSAAPSRRRSVATEGRIQNRRR